MVIILLFHGIPTFCLPNCFPLIIFMTENNMINLRLFFRCSRGEINPLTLYIFLSFSVSVSVCLSVSLSVFLYRSISFSFLSMSVCLYVCLSICISVYLSLSLSLYLSLSFSVSLCLSPPLCLSMASVRDHHRGHTVIVHLTRLTLNAPLT